MTLGGLFDGVDRGVRAILDRCLDGGEPSVDDALLLCSVNGRELHALLAVADELRRRQAGDEVAYVVNRNVNFTNVCVKACRFCAFSRTQRSDEGYFLDVEEIVRRAVEARDVGATEVCIQAGLAPGLDGRFYVELVRAIKRAAPELHLHAFSPEEVKYGAELRGQSIADFLAELRDAGLGSLPGTSAEVLDDELRHRIAPGRITTAEWIEVISSAHRLGLPTTSTLMYGHVESDAQRMRHLDTLRTIQKETHGFTEFVPLSFVHQEAPMHVKQYLPDLRPGPDGKRGRAALCSGALDARAEHQEHPGVVGQRGHSHGAVDALVRRQRSRRHAHQREHLDRRRRRARAVPIARRAAPHHPRSGPRAGAARHPLSQAAHLWRDGGA